MTKVKLLCCFQTAKKVKGTCLIWLWEENSAHLEGVQFAVENKVEKRTWKQESEQHHAVEMQFILTFFMAVKCKWVSTGHFFLKLEAPSQVSRLTLNCTETTKPQDVVWTLNSVLFPNWFNSFTSECRSNKQLTSKLPHRYRSRGGPIQSMVTV